MMKNNKISISVISLIISLIVANFIATIISVKRADEIGENKVQADRQCRPGIYKTIINSENRVICVGGKNEEWVVKLK